MVDGTIYRFFPPGIRPDLERANPFNLVSSTDKPPSNEGKSFSYEEAVGKDVGLSKNATTKAESSGKPTFRSEEEVVVWGSRQISTKLNQDEIELAHRYAKIWQARIVYDINHSPIESLYIGYSVIIHNMLVNGLCRPQAGISGAVRELENGNIRFGSMECLRTELLR